MNPELGWGTRAQENEMLNAFRADGSAGNLQQKVSPTDEGKKKSA